MKIDVDALAQEIRRVDGNHSLGAGALAEALMPFLTAALAVQTQQRVEVKPLDWRPEAPYHVARIFGNLYAVEGWDGGATLSGIGGRRDFPSVAEAKAAAFADYKDRVLALVDVPAVESEPAAYPIRVVNDVVVDRYGAPVSAQADRAHSPRSLSNDLAEKGAALAKVFLANYSGMEDGDGNEAPELALARDILALSTRKGSAGDGAATGTKGGADE